MHFETSPNRFFRPPPESALGEDEVRSRIRSEFFDLRSRFLDRLACAQVFDRELFDAVRLSLDTLRRSYAAADSPMATSDFNLFDSIAVYLDQEAHHSHNQREECAKALTEWRRIMEEYGISSEGSPS